jgi:hypothetical protein
VSAFYRWRGIPWRESIRRIHSIVGEDVPALVDSTGVGDPVLEELQVEHGNFYGFNFTLTGKQKLMEGLAVSIQGHEIGFPDGPIRQELESYQYETTRTSVRYSVPEGENDDCVCALALARQMWTEMVPGKNVIEYMQDIGRRTRLSLPTEGLDTFNLPDGSLRRLEPPKPEVDLADDNPLLDLAVSFLPDSTPMCRFCHHPVLSRTVITDGFDIWHPECGGLSFNSHVVP